MKHTPTTERNEKIFLALTKIYRGINNGNTKVVWHKTFEEQGLHNPNCVTLVKNTLQKMKIIKISSNGETTWNRAYTAPNPKLVEGIFAFAKQNRAPKAPKAAAPDKPSKGKTNAWDWVVNTTWGIFHW